MLGEFFVKKLNTNDKTVSEMMTSNLKIKNELEAIN